jgi:xanthine dehydrogenase accessory factor
MSKNVSDILDLAAELAAAGRDYCVVTVVRTANATSAKAGAKAIVTADGTLHGFVGGGCVQGAVTKTAREALETGEARLIRVKPKEEVVEQVDTDGVELHKSSCPSGGTIDLFLEPMRQAMRVVVCGASPVAATLVSLAKAMGYRVALAALTDDHAKAPGADTYLAGFDLGALPVTPNDAVVVATQGKRDREALTAALASGAFYVGMVGSRTKIGKLIAQLADKGIAPERLAALHGPAGLHIAAIEPEEIALSILSEIVQERRHATKGADVELERA